MLNSDVVFCSLWFIRFSCFFFVCTLSRSYVRCWTFFFSILLFILVLYAVARQSNRYLKQYIRLLKSGKLWSAMRVFVSRARDSNLSKKCTRKNWMSEHNGHTRTFMYINSNLCEIGRCLFFPICRWLFAFFYSICSTFATHTHGTVNGPRWLYSFWLYG